MKVRELLNDLVSRLAAGTIDLDSPVAISKKSIPHPNHAVIFSDDEFYHHGLPDPIYSIVAISHKNNKLFGH